MERDALLQKLLTFTVAICSLNGEKRLPATLKNLFDQIPSETRVIVVDDGSIDRTSEIAREHGAIVIRHEKNVGYGQARQSAVQMCETDILAFVDDECLISPEWFITLQKVWQLMYPEIVALAGPMIPTSKGLARRYLQSNNPFTPIRLLPKKQSNFFERINRYLFPNYSLHSGYIESAANGNLSIAMSALSKLSGYNTTLNLGGEDVELCGRIQKEFGSMSIYFDQKLWVTHDMNESISPALKRSYRYGRTAAYLWKRSGGIPTFLPLPIVFIFFTFLFIAMAPWVVTVAFLIAYPNIVSLSKLPWKFDYLLYNLLNPYIRIIIEIAHNFGFINACILGIVSSPESSQSQLVTKR